MSQNGDPRECSPSNAPNLHVPANYMNPSRGALQWSYTSFPRTIVTRFLWVVCLGARCSLSVCLGPSHSTCINYLNQTTASKHIVCLNASARIQCPWRRNKQTNKWMNRQIGLNLTVKHFASAEGKNLWVCLGCWMMLMASCFQWIAWILSSTVPERKIRNTLFTTTLMRLYGVTKKKVNALENSFHFKLLLFIFFVSWNHRKLTKFSSSTNYSSIFWWQKLQKVTDSNRSKKLCPNSWRESSHTKNDLGIFAMAMVCHNGVNISSTKNEFKTKWSKKTKFKIEFFRFCMGRCSAS